MDTKTVKASIYGTVQGVFFRHHTQLQAEALGLRGWVKNCSDGSVEAVICGAEQDVDTMITWLHHGPDSAHVVRVEIDETHQENLLPDHFEVRY